MVTTRVYKILRNKEIMDTVIVVEHSKGTCESRQAMPDSSQL